MLLNGVIRSLEKLGAVSDTTASVVTEEEKEARRSRKVERKARKEERRVRRVENAEKRAGHGRHRDRDGDEDGVRLRDRLSRSRSLYGGEMGGSVVKEAQESIENSASKGGSRRAGEGS